MLQCLKSSSSLRASANSPSVSSPAPASPIRVDISSSTYFLVPHQGLVGAVRLVIVADVPAFMFNVPSIVTLVNVDVPEPAVTLPVRFPVTLPVTSPVTLPVTITSYVAS